MTQPTKVPVPRTMKAMSMMEVENRKKLNFMVPMDIAGRHQIMDKLKDLTIDVDHVIVKPVDRIPSVIRNIESFFSTDGYWYGNFIAYGTSTMGKQTLLWDDITIANMAHFNTMVDTQYIKERLMDSNPVTLIVSKVSNDKHYLVFYCYMP